MKSFHVESAKRKLQLITMRYAVTYAINGFIYLAIILPDIAIENYERVKRLGTVRSAYDWQCRSVTLLIVS